MRHSFEHGVAKSDRTGNGTGTGTGTRSVFGHQMRFDLNDGFPARAAPEVAGSCHSTRRLRYWLPICVGSTNWPLRMRSFMQRRRSMAQNC